MKRVEQEIFRDDRRTITASADLPDDAVVVSQPGQGQLAWAQNSTDQCPEQTDHWSGLEGIRCTLDVGHSGHHRIKDPQRGDFTWTHDEHNCVRYRNQREAHHG